MLPVDNQVQELYEINDDPKRKEFLDDLFSFMQRRGTPINRLPIMAKSVLDLYELYNLVIARGGLVDVINKKLWQEIIKGLHLPSSITSAAFTLRTQYMKYLYPYECEKKNLSNPSELQAAIDGNKREGRRSSYGQFDSSIQSQLQLPLQRSPVSSGMQQMSPMSLVTHGGAQQAAHRLMGAPNVGQMPNLMSHEIEQRMMEYIKLFQPQQNRAQSPDMATADAMNALEMSRVALWRKMYETNNGSPPASLINPAGSPGSTESSRFNNHAFPDHAPIKRERDMSGGDYTEHDFTQPPAKRPSDFSRASLTGLTQSNLNEILAAAAATNGITGNGGMRNLFHHPQNDEEDEEEEERDHHRDHEDRDHEMEDQHEAKMRDQSLHHLSNAAIMSHQQQQQQQQQLQLQQQQQQLQQQKRQLTRDSPPTFRRVPEEDEVSEVEDEEMDDDHHHSHHDHRSSFLPSLFGGLQFKISKVGISDSGEPELCVSMEINNVTYEGSLFAAATKKNLKLHKVAHKHSPLNTSSPVKSTTSSSGSAVTTQMVSPKNTSNGSSHHNNNEADMMNNNCVSKNPHFLEPEVQIHSPPSPLKTAPVTAPRIGPKDARKSVEDEDEDNDQLKIDEDDRKGEAEQDDEEEEDLSMKPKKMSHLEDMRVVGAQPMVSS